VLFVLDVRYAGLDADIFPAMGGFGKPKHRILQIFSPLLGAAEGEGKVQISNDPTTERGRTHWELEWPGRGFGG
jgi:hypothetical protein